MKLKTIFCYFRHQFRTQWISRSNTKCHWRCTEHYWQRTWNEIMNLIKNCVKMSLLLIAASLHPRIPPLQLVCILIYLQIISDGGVVDQVQDGITTFLGSSGVVLMYDRIRYTTSLLLYYIIVTYIFCADRIRYTWCNTFKRTEQWCHSWQGHMILCTVLQVWSGCRAVLTNCTCWDDFLSWDILWTAWLLTSSSNIWEEFRLSLWSNPAAAVSHTCHNHASGIVDGQKLCTQRISIAKIIHPISILRL